MFFSYSAVLSQVKQKKDANFCETDFNVLNSTNKYLELEFTPAYTNDGIGFNNSLQHSDRYGSPDVGYRAFPLFLPSHKNNRIEIIDIKYDEILNIEIKPVPTPKRANNKYEILYDYRINEKIYNINSFYPQEPAILVENGVIRNRYSGSLCIYPVQYNPLTKQVKKILYIRLRVVFGSNPIFLNKKLNNEEILFLSGDIAVNSKTALNWSTIEFNSLKDNPLLQNSVFAASDFYRIEIKESGIYKIDKNLLQQIGINVNNIDPRKIHIYGNGGNELPYNNSVQVPLDIVENRIYVEGEDDGVFNDNDYILFYGVSANDWEYYPNEQTFRHYLNHYSVSNYYFITVSETNGLRMQKINSTSYPNIPPVNEFTDRFFEEPEIDNYGSTGTLWVSQKIVTGEGYTFNKEVKGYIPGSNIRLRLRYGNLSSNVATFLIEDKNSSFSILRQVSPVSAQFSHIVLDFFETEYQLNPGKFNIDLRVSLPAQYNNPAVSGCYDYYEILYKRSMNSAFNNVLRFYSPDTLGLVEYNISSFNSANTPLIIDVSNKLNPDLIIPYAYVDGIVKFQDDSSPGSIKEYYAIGGNNFKTPASISQKIPKQNLIGITNGANFVIITPTEFTEAANRLKNLRENQNSTNYISTIVVDVNQIYNEFSGGLLDPLAIRNFLKYAYNNWQQRPVYVLFFGDGSYDFKNIYNLAIKNFLPTVQKPDAGNNEIVSYPSDDFIIEINEFYNEPTPGRPDFSTGRLCVNTLAEANAILDKIQVYESPSTFDKWKKKIMYVADDGWTTENNQGQEGNIHTQQCEDIAEYFTTRDFEKEKIYIVTYPAVITPQGRRKPSANADIIKGWNDGRLIINYTGHGSTDLWAHEHIFVRSESIPQLNNKNRYPFVTIASCDLARWDDPFLISAAEQLVYEASKGAIGVVAAVRPVYSSPNAIFNNTLWSNIMFHRDSLHLPLRFGKIMYNCKNQLSSITDNDAKFCYIGDPSLRIGIPQHITVIDSINGSPYTDTAQIKALQKVKITGHVIKPDSTFWNDYNGTIFLKVFDVDKNIVFYDFNLPFYFRLDGGIIFNGKTEVQNGLWNIEFIVPKDISYTHGTGKIIAYFKNNSTEGSGFSNMFRLNGIDSTAVIDTTGPVITAFMDSKNFKSGDIVGQNPKLIVDFFDESGINLTNTIGHKIEGILNYDENNKIDLTSLYNTTQGYQYGNLEYQFNNLPDGKYNLKIKAWDTYNNFNTTDIYFMVKNTSSLKVANICNFPNPMTDNTVFYFQHNLSGISYMNTEIKIYTVSGRLIKTINKVSNDMNEGTVRIEWDGKDNDGDYIANGTYIYRIIIKSSDGNYNYNATGKLVKLK